MSIAEKPIRSMREQICEVVRAEVFSGEMTNDQPVREQPLAGSLVKIDPGVRGVAAFSYAG